MSFNKFQMKSLVSTDNTPIKKQLNEIWKQFMISFGYQKYYNFQKEINNKLNYNLYNSTINSYGNNSSFILSLKSFLDFLEQNLISISENNNYHKLFSNSKKGLSLLSEAKIYIMYILFIDQKYDNNNYYQNKIVIIMNLFKEAIKNNCDIISLFEFFLIYISKIEHEDFSIFKSKQIMEILPKEFILLYIKNKSILKNIFCKNNCIENKDSNIGNNSYFYIPNSVWNTQSSIFSTNKIKNDKNLFQIDMNNENEESKLEEKKNNSDKYDNNNNNDNIINNNINLDINNIVVICKDYLNKGYFAIFKEKKNLKKDEEDIIKNPFLGNNNDDEEDDENYYLMPLLQKYDNYEQKMDANKTLILINKSIYKDYTYYPYDLSIISKL